MKLGRTLSTALAVSALALTAACGGSSSEATSAAGGSAAPTLRLGYFANVTHAGAVYGIADGGFQQALGSTALTPSVFNAGPAAVEALAGGAIDAAFLGPNPAVNGFVNSGGKLLRIVAGTTYGGAALVVKPEITDVSQLAGKKIATPQLGNTQDVAAKAYFKEHGVEGVEILNQENAQSLDLLKRGEIDGGWVPEPWASRLQIEGGGKVLIDEADLWPEGRFVTTHLVVRQDYLQKNPAVVEALLKGLVTSTEQVSTKSPKVLEAVNRQIEKDTGKALPVPVLEASFENLTPSLDPIAESLKKSAADAAAVGVSRAAPDLTGIYDLRPLNAILKAAGESEVSDGGLGV